MTIPTLITERLTMRAPCQDDFEAFAAFYASDRSRYVGGPEDRMSSWRRLAAMVGHWSLRGYGFWAVEEEGAVRGMVGLWYPEGWPEPEIGWELFEGAEGRGIAHEAALAARAHAHGPLGWTTAISTIHPENARSIALVERMGARRDGDFHHPKVGTVGIWRHPGPHA